jgi:tetratricopeptide (TPR) repeat protein
MAMKPRRRLGAAAPVVPEAATPPKPRFHVPSLATLSSDLRTLFINVCIIAVFVLLIPVVGVQFLRNQVVIEPISVPTALLARGLNPDVAAIRLWDGLQDAQALATTSKAGMSSIPNSLRVDFSIPDSGISIDSLVYYVRQFFHAYGTRITGEFRCADATCAPDGMLLRVRLLRDHLDVVEMPPIGTTPEAQYFRDAAIRILALLDLFIGAAAEADGNPLKAMADAERLVLIHHPDAKWAANLVGRLKGNLKDSDAAIAAFRQALALDPNFRIAKINLASALVDKGRFDEAQKLLDEAAASAPTDRFLVLGRAKLAMAEKKYDEAIGDLLAGDARDPGTSVYLLMAANVAYAAGKLDDAASFASRILELDPGDYDSVTYVYAIDVAQEKPELAETVLRRALGYAPANAAIEDELALVLVELDRFDEALVHLDHVIGEAPAETAYQITRAQTLKALNRNKDAIAQLDTAQKLDPGNPTLAMEYGDNFRAMGRKNEAIAAYNRVIAANADPTDVLLAKRFIEIMNAQPAVTAPTG